MSVLFGQQNWRIARSDGFAASDLLAVRDAVEGNGFAPGELTSQFEEAFAELLGVSHVIAVEVGDLAAVTAIASVGLGPKDHVVTNPFAPTAVAQALALHGCSVTIADTEPVRPRMNLEQLRKALARRTRAVITPHVTGCHEQMDEVLDLALDRGLLVVEEASGMVGCGYRMFRVGALGHLAVVDLSTTPTFQGCSGGLVVTNIDTLAERARMFTRGGYARQGNGTPFAPGIEASGLRCAMTDLQAARAMVRLDALQTTLAHLTSLAHTYTRGFNGAKHITVPDWLRTDGPLPTYVVRVEVRRAKSSMIEIGKAVRSLGFDCGPPLAPLQASTHFQTALKLRGAAAPNSEAWWRRTLRLPLRPDMRESDAEEIAKMLRGLAGG